MLGLTVPRQSGERPNTLSILRVGAAPSLDHLVGAGEQRRPPCESRHTYPRISSHLLKFKNPAAPAVRREAGRCNGQGKQPSSRDKLPML